MINVCSLENGSPTIDMVSGSPCIALGFRIFPQTAFVAENDKSDKLCVCLGEMVAMLGHLRLEYRPSFGSMRWSKRKHTKDVRPDIIV